MLLQVKVFRVIIVHISVRIDFIAAKLVKNTRKQKRWVCFLCASALFLFIHSFKWSAIKVGDCFGSNKESHGFNILFFVEYRKDNAIRKAINSTINRFLRNDDFANI